MILFRSGKLAINASWFVKTRIPKNIINVPKIIVAYFRCLLIRATNWFAWVINPPIMTNGMPNPKEYARSRLNEILGAVAASVRIAPKIGPMHGVHPPANASPKRNDNG